MAKSKAYRAAAEKLEEGKQYSLEEAVALARETGSAKFNSTVEVASASVSTRARQTRWSAVP